MRFLSLILIFCLQISTNAWADATFGAEFNFTNFTLRAAQPPGPIVNTPASEEARDRFAQKVKEVCRDCRVTASKNDYGVKTYKVRYPDGWYFVIATDPAVVEVQTKPSTVQEIQKQLSRIQKDIFDVADAVHLLPASHIMGREWAASHIHVGALSALGEGRDAARNLRNFMVDFSNHPELALGIFSHDMNNAPPLANLPVAQIENFQKIIDDVDSGKIRSVNTFARRVRKEVYHTTINENISPPTKYHAFNVNRLGNDDFAPNERTFELRAMRGQESAMDFLLLTRLIDARIRYLQSLNQNVELNFQLNPRLLYSEDAQTEAFYRYVTETGLDFKAYERFLPLNHAFKLPEVRARVRLSCSRLRLAM